MVETSLRSHEVCLGFHSCLKYILINKVNFTTRSILLSEETSGLHREEEDNLDQIQLEPNNCILGPRIQQK